MIEELITEYEDYLIENEVSEETKRGYMTTLKQLNNYFVDNDLDFSKRSLLSYKEFLTKKKYKESTINQRLTAVNIFVKWCCKEDKICEKFEKMQIKHIRIQEKSHREYLDYKQFKRLIKKCEDKETELFMLTIMNTFLRIGGVQQITKKDITNNKKFNVISKGKVISVAPPVWLKKELNDYFKDKEDVDYLFSKSGSTYRSRMKRLAKKSRVPEHLVYPHALRHLGAKEYLKATGDIGTLQQLLAHSDISTTTVYAALNKSELADIQRKIKHRK